MNISLSLRIFLCLFLSQLFFVDSFAQCEHEFVVKPAHPLKKNAYVDNFKKKYGNFLEFDWNLPDLNALCTAPTNNTKNNPLLFVIDRKCIIHSSKPYSSKRQPNHIIISHGKEIIGGGELICTIDNQNNKIFLITNKSSRFCFDISHVSHLIHKLNTIGIPLANIFVKKSNAKFCAETKDRIRRYNEIIDGSNPDFGYKSSNMYRADQFLQLDFKN